MSNVVSKTTSIESLRLLTISNPSLHALSYALRHPEVWPKGFIWNYEDCEMCAMGLAHQLWSDLVPETDPNNGASLIAAAFAMPYTEAKSIFMGSNSWVPQKDYTTGYLWWKKHWTTGNFSLVTPDMVADQIDKYLESVE